MIDLVPKAGLPGEGSSRYFAREPIKKSRAEKPGF
jgi:hypothetical protein